MRLLLEDDFQEESADSGMIDFDPESSNDYSEENSDMVEFDVDNINNQDEQITGDDLENQDYNNEEEIDDDFGNESADDFEDQGPSLEEIQQQKELEKQKRKEDNCITLNNKLIKFFDVDIDKVKEKIDKAFDILNGKVETSKKGDSIVYKGSIDDYDIVGVINPDTKEDNLKELRSDLVMAYNISHGGNRAKTKPFINYLEKRSEAKEEGINESMGKWIYTLKSGTRLRDSINSGDYAEILDCIRECYDELAENGIIDEDDYYSYVGSLEDIDLYDDESDIEESIDYELNELYDLCDNINVWIPINTINESFKDCINGKFKLSYNSTYYINEEKVTDLIESLHFNSREKAINYANQIMESTDSRSWKKTKSGYIKESKTSMDYDEIIIEGK